MRHPRFASLEKKVHPVINVPYMGVPNGNTWKQSVRHRGTNPHNPAVVRKKPTRLSRRAACVGSHNSPACCADVAARIRTRHAPAPFTLQRHAVAGVVRASRAFHTGLCIASIIAARRRLRRLTAAFATLAAAIERMSRA